MAHYVLADIHADAERFHEMLKKIAFSPADVLYILDTPGYTDIDCGCGHDVPGAVLACLRLEDMKEFYV